MKVLLVGGPGHGHVITLGDGAGPTWAVKWWQTTDMRGYPPEPGEITTYVRGKYATRYKDGPVGQIRFAYPQHRHLPGVDEIMSAVMLASGLIELVEP
jgi:hypothetical protein